MYFYQHTHAYTYVQSKEGTTPKHCSDDGIYSVVFDALPRGSTSKVVGGHKNKVKQ